MLSLRSFFSRPVSLSSLGEKVGHYATRVAMVLGLSVPVNAMAQETSALTLKMDQILTSAPELVKKNPHTSSGKIILASAHQSQRHQDSLVRRSFGLNMEDRLMDTIIAPGQKKDAPTQNTSAPLDPKLPTTEV